MLALLHDGAPRLVRDHGAPSRAPGEALIRMRCAGVCDTDLQLAHGYMNYRGVLGHEFVGEVLEADSAEWIGRRVVADINAGCGACDDCLQRDGHHCSSRTVLGILGRDGAFAERLVVPERSLVQVPDSVPDELAVFAEPLAAALHVLDAAEPGAGPWFVLGDGKLGLLITFALCAAGADVTLVGHHVDKLALATRAGARTALESELPAGERPAAVVVEATGSANGFRRALDLARPRGKVVLKTTVAGPVEVDLSPVVIDEIQVLGSRCGNLTRAMQLLASGKLDPSPLITARYPLERADAALQRASERGVLKVLIGAKS